MSQGEAPEFHGLRLQVPSSWQEQSFYRYIVPTAQGAEDPTLHANVIITRHAAQPGTELQQVLPRPSQGVGQRGAGTLGGLPAAWLDIDFDSELAGVHLLQRQIAVRADDATVIVLTLTSVETSLDAISAQMGFAKN